MNIHTPRAQHIEFLVATVALGAILVVAAIGYQLGQAHAPLLENALALVSAIVR